MKYVAIALLAVCACTMQTSHPQPVATGALAPAASAPPLGFGVPDRPQPPPAGERVTKVPIVLFGYETLAGPDVIEAQPPSSAYPEGTVYSAMYRSAYDEQKRVREAPYLYEWDVARAEIVRHVTPALSALVGSPPRIDFDGTHVVMLSQQFDDDAYKGWARLEMYDRQLTRVRERRLVRGHAVAFGARGEVAVVSSVAPEARASIQLFDGSLRAKATTRIRVVAMGLGPAKPLWHAGDSFYVVAHTSPGHLAVVRLDDRTLRERARSAELPLPTEESTASLTKTDDDWVLIVDESMFRLDERLHVSPVGVIDTLTSPPYAWHRGRALSIAATTPGSSVYSRCTPRWVFGTPLFACADLDEVTMVRPALQPGWSPKRLPE